MMIRWAILLLCVFSLPAATPEKKAPEFHTVTGEILSRSKLPPAAASRYPDCRYTAEFQVDKNEFGIPAKITVILPGFRDRKNTPEAAFRAGDRLELSVAPFEDMSETEQTARIADTLNDLARPWYWSSRAAKLPAPEKP